MSDLVGTQIVDFLTHRLKCIFFAMNIFSHSVFRFMLTTVHEVCTGLVQKTHSACQDKSLKLCLDN